MWMLFVFLLSANVFAMTEYEKRLHVDSVKNFTKLNKELQSLGLERAFLQWFKARVRRFSPKLSFKEGLAAEERAKSSVDAEVEKLQKSLKEKRKSLNKTKNAEYVRLLNNPYVRLGKEKVSMEEFTSAARSENPPDFAKYSSRAFREYDFSEKEYEVVGALKTFFETDPFMVLALQKADQMRFIPPIKKSFKGDGSAPGYSTPVDASSTSATDSSTTERSRSARRKQKSTRVVNSVLGGVGVGSSTAHSPRGRSSVKKSPSRAARSSRSSSCDSSGSGGYETATGDGEVIYMPVLDALHETPTDEVDTFSIMEGESALLPVPRLPYNKRLSRGLQASQMPRKERREKRADKERRTLPQRTVPAPRTAPLGGFGLPVLPPDENSFVIPPRDVLEQRLAQTPKI